MKKYLPFAKLLILSTGCLGMAMMYWLFSAGTDERGLYPAGHPGWILSAIISILVVAAVWLLARQAGNNRNRRQNFPPSVSGALGCAVAAIGLFWSGLQSLQAGKMLGIAAGAMGILSAVSMLWAAYCRFRGMKHKFPVHMFPCFFFALQLFVLGQEYGAEPEICRYFYRFCAALSMVPACYWLWSFDVSMGKRPACLFWCLLAGYCNLVAVAGSAHWPLHICMAVWMLTALPRLRYLPKVQHTAPQTVDTEAATEQAQPADQAPAEDMVQADLPTEEDKIELPDPDAILAQLLRDLDQQEKA